MSSRELARSISSSISRQLASTRNDIDILNVPQVSELLVENGFDADVVQCMRSNKIDGITLLQLNSGDLKELGIVALGDRKRLERLCKLPNIKVKNTVYV